MTKMTIPESFVQIDGSSTLIYDSRNVRGTDDVVLIFSHPKVSLKIIYSMFQFSF